MIFLLFSLKTPDIILCTQFVLKRYKRSPEIELLLDFRAMFLSWCKVVYRVWGKLVYPQNDLIFMLFSELIYMIKSQFYHARNPDITRFSGSMSTKKDLEDFTLQGLIFYVAGG